MTVLPTKSSTIYSSRVTYSLTIADGASLSDAADLRGYRISRIITPSGWDAAVITFETSADDSTYGAAYDGDGNEITVPSLTAARQVNLTPTQQAALMGADFLKVRSGTSGSAVNQSGAVTVIVVAVPLGA